MAKAPIIHPHTGKPIEPVPRLEFSKWSAQWNLDPEYGLGSRQIQLNWWWPRAKGHRFGYDNTYYDGVHKSITVGPINLYWNW
jgi:hypothetical protein